jgi:hypothetical protein
LQIFIIPAVWLAVNTIINQSPLVFKILPLALKYISFTAAHSSVKLQILDKVILTKEETMGRRDFRQHETKKPKKDGKKSIVGTTSEPLPEVEVIKRGKKEKPEF